MDQDFSDEFFGCVVQGQIKSHPLWPSVLPFRRETLAFLDEDAA